MKLIGGKYVLTEDDVRIGPDDIEIKHSGFDTIKVKAYVETWFDVDARFGLKTYDTDDFVTVYVEYTPYTGVIQAFYTYHLANGKVDKEVEVDLIREECDMLLSVLMKAGFNKLIEANEERKRKENYSHSGLSSRVSGNAIDPLKYQMYSDISSMLKAENSDSNEYDDTSDNENECGIEDWDELEEWEKDEYRNGLRF
jgi:hypothetical protein